MQNFLTHILSGHSLPILTTVYCEITEFIKSVAKKITFVNWPMKYRHKKAMNTMEHLVAPFNKSAVFSKHPGQ